MGGAGGGVGGGGDLESRQKKETPKERGKERKHKGSYDNKWNGRKQTLDTRSKTQLQHKT